MIRAPTGSVRCRGQRFRGASSKSAKPAWKNLGIDCRRTFRMSRVDPTVPIEDSAGASWRARVDSERPACRSPEACARNGPARQCRPSTSIAGAAFWRYLAVTQDAQRGHLATCDLGLALIPCAARLRLSTGAVGGSRSHCPAGDTRHKVPRFHDENASVRPGENRQDIAATFLPTPPLPRSPSPGF